LAGVTSYVLIIDDKMLIALHLENPDADLGHRSIDFVSTRKAAVTRAADRPPSIILSDVRLG
jgi:PleD family two-component response regulator